MYRLWTKRPMFPYAHIGNMRVAAWCGRTCAVSDVLRQIYGEINVRLCATTDRVV